MEKVFESDRIDYVKVTNELINDYLKMVNDMDIQKYITHNVREYSYEDEEGWIKMNLENNNMIFSMIEKSTGDFIGSIELKKKDDGLAELGICITKDKQDNHFGAESIERIIEYGYKNGFKKFELNVFDFNPRAIRCYEKVGFIKDGPGKEENDIHMIYKGK